MLPVIVLIAALAVSAPALAHPKHHARHHRHQVTLEEEARWVHRRAPIDTLIVHTRPGTVVVVKRDGK